jgi:hypothetical protein
MGQMTKRKIPSKANSKNPFCECLRKACRERLNISWIRWREERFSAISYPIEQVFIMLPKHEWEGDLVLKETRKYIVVIPKFFRLQHEWDGKRIRKDNKQCHNENHKIFQIRK